MRTHKLSSGEVSDPASYDQVSRLMSYDHVTCDVSRSQLMKRLSVDDADELMKLARWGVDVEISGELVS